MAYSFDASFFRMLLDQKSIQPKLIFVIGCGSAADEAYHVQHATNTFVIGVDLEGRQERHNSDDLQLLRCNAEQLLFRNSTFNAIYSYHTLERVKDDQTMLKEMQRVLAIGGIAYVGTPNKLRLIGYIAGRELGDDQGCRNILQKQEHGGLAQEDSSAFFEGRHSGRSQKEDCGSSHGVVFVGHDCRSYGKRLLVSVKRRIQKAGSASLSVGPLNREPLTQSYS